MAGDKGFVQQLTQLVQTQIAMVATQTRAMSAQSLPLLKDYSGEVYSLVSRDLIGGLSNLKKELSRLGGLRILRGIISKCLCMGQLIRLIDCYLMR